MKKKVRERLARIEDALEVLIAEVAKLQPSSHRPPDGRSGKQTQAACSQSKSIENEPRKRSPKRAPGTSRGTDNRNVSHDS